MCMREKESERVCVRERERVCLCVFKREREREREEARKPIRSFKTSLNLKELEMGEVMQEQEQEK